MLHRQVDMLLKSEKYSNSWTLYRKHLNGSANVALYFKHVVVNSFYFRSVQKSLYCMAAYICLLNKRLTLIPLYIMITSMSTWSMKHIAMSTYSISILACKKNSKRLFKNYQLSPTRDFRHARCNLFAGETWFLFLFRHSAHFCQYGTFICRYMHATY